MSVRPQQRAGRGRAQWQRRVRRISAGQRCEPERRRRRITVLHAAVLRGDLDLVKAALLHGANPNAQTASGTPVKRQSADFFLPAALVRATPLLLAAKYASTDIMRVLLDTGAD